MTPRVLLALLAACVGGGSGGCFSLTGMGIGLAVDGGAASAAEAYPAEPTMLEEGDQVIVRWGQRYRVAGEFVRLVRGEDRDPRSLVVRARASGRNHEIELVALDGVERFDRAGGTGWALGLGIGAALDVTGIVVGLLLIQGLPSHW